MALRRAVAMHGNQLQEEEGEGLEVEVWDLPTRVFHWLLVVLVALGWATAEISGPLFVVHKFSGYTLIAALLFRVVWGIAGSRHARFGDFVRPWRVVRGYAARLLRLSPPRFIGHNPLGGWMVLVLLATLFLLAASGLFSADDDIAGPLARYLPGRLAHGAAEVHETLFNLLLVLVGVHVAGVLLDSLLTGDNLIRSMWNGRKRLGLRLAHAEEPPVPAFWAVPVAVVAVAMVWLAFA
jgi:cytochrome b